jgi:hypothetical protein
MGIGSGGFNMSEIQIRKNAVAIWLTVVGVLLAIYLISGYSDAIEMRPQANINLTGHNLTYVSCVRFNDGLWQCTVVNGSAFFANITALYANDTALWTNASAQEALIQAAMSALANNQTAWKSNDSAQEAYLLILYTNASDQQLKIGVLDVNMSGVQTRLGTLETMKTCAAGQYVNGTNGTNIYCGAPAAGGEFRPEMVQIPEIGTNISIQNGNLNVTGNITLTSKIATYGTYLILGLKGTNDYGLSADFLNVLVNQTGLTFYANKYQDSNRLYRILARSERAGNTNGFSFGLVDKTFTTPPENYSVYPNDDKKVGLGTTVKCWDKFYYYTQYDCGSPTERIKDKALPLIRRLAKAHQSARLSSTTAADEVFYSNVPAEFQGEEGACGHNVTIVDEVINALVLGEGELSEAVEDKGYCVSDEQELIKRVGTLEDRVDAQDKAIDELYRDFVLLEGGGILTLLGLGAAFEYRYRKGG